MVGATGIEPVTPAVSRQCSTAELRKLGKVFLFIFPAMSKYCQTKEVTWQALDNEELDGMFK